MIKSTWQEEPEKRPSFSDIVRFLQDQNITDTCSDFIVNHMIVTY